MTPYSRCIARSGCCVFLFAALSTGAAAAETSAKESADKEEWITLFNGRDLDRLDTEDHGPRTRRQLRRHVPRRGRAAQGELRQVQVLRQASSGTCSTRIRTPTTAWWSNTASSVSRRRRAREVGGAQQRRDAAFAASAHDGTRPGLPDIDRVQFLGGLDDGKQRSTMNLCTPGTDVVYEGSIYPEHCLTSKSKTFDGDQWVRAEVLVLGSGQDHPSSTAKEVLEYALPQFGGGRWRISIRPRNPTAN